MKDVNELVKMAFRTGDPTDPRPQWWRLDAGHQVIGEDTEPMCIEKDGAQFVEGVGLGGQSRTVAFHEADEAVNHLVVEGVHPSAGERRTEMVLQEGVEVSHRRDSQVPLPGLPLLDVLLEPH
ncbi:hypothetical protein [Streptomyces bungoensis]|uniref:hypothetical protein n=1 Tax=Streptomyces bungoensis TaxID=285568 RepID=UPI00131D1B1B|nr:hypothetical protein [Streptomyces bungoensis]